MIKKPEYIKTYCCDKFVDLYLYYDLEIFSRYALIKFPPSKLDVPPIKLLCCPSCGRKIHSTKEVRRDKPAPKSGDSE